MFRTSNYSRYIVVDMLMLQQLQYLYCSFGSNVVHHLRRPPPERRGDKEVDLRSNSECRQVCIDLHYVEIRASYKGKKSLGEAEDVISITLIVAQRVQATTPYETDKLSKRLSIANI